MAMAAVQGENTLIGLAQDFDLHPQQIKQWRDQLLDGAAGVFGAAPKAEAHSRHLALLCFRELFESTLR